MDKTKKQRTTKKPPISHKLRSAGLSFYYGNPAKDLKLIAIMGGQGQGIAAHLIHDILTASGEKSALLLDTKGKPMTTASFHRFLSKSWKSGANFVVFEASRETIKGGAFYKLPLYATIVMPEEHSSVIPSDQATTLLETHPHFIILSRDDPSYPVFAKYTAKTTTTSYGRHSESITRITSHKLYKRGSEVNLQLNNKNLPVASFFTSEDAIPAMAAAVTLASLMDIAEDLILDGLATHEP